MDKLLKQETKQTLEQRKKAYIALAEKIIEKDETFPFPGIDLESYEELEALSKEFPERSPDIDKLIERFEKKGFKVVFSGDPTSGNIFIIPAESTDIDIEMDSLFPRHLSVTPKMNTLLKELILTNKELILINKKLNK